ncbi:cobW-domain-containing protein [Wallemia mellicola]|uniref:CobW-domain-containing protein n=1 Tax=Wallemia mellicola TaxID=1708541 RepID=A0A4T0R8J5_9BASI|nr:hypothetical protein E3Q23_00286 [Wallemia mellicola]TIB97900.1 cobW-domain-containing protein [Wallemia mellicola]TIC16054.1 cobW-domain-containing protein [Wallemia mellicola]TIC17356.1 cobW-domain-containing protein [Wallemia mellicola]TIC34279.1 cobW-domain-containing protein [Wallemia mellicola]
MSATQVITKKPRTEQNIKLNKVQDDRLPVTLLSGFLGSGKTTLLERILKSKDHGLRCAIIVNDMSSLNIDAATVENHKLTKAGEKMVQMQNGWINSGYLQICSICCTLREDLLEQIALLTEEKVFDYLLIESTGISEPMQVAETFSFEFLEEAVKIEESLAENSTKDKATQSKMANILAKGGLPKVARLDTTVTVVDALNVLNDFNTTDFITDRPQEVGQGELDESDERNVTDLLVDQIEFADVILVNKCDLATKEVVTKVTTLIKTLNPRADVIPTTKCDTDLSKILNTHKFDFEAAVTGAGWLQSLREMLPIEVKSADGTVQRHAPKPETEEYGISNFVYKRRRPFHPLRLWLLISKYWVIIQDSLEEGEEGEDDDEEEGMEDDKNEDANEEEEVNTTEQPQLDPAARLRDKKASIFAPLFRAKGFIWLPGREQMGEISQAGVMMTVGGGNPWFVSTPESEWDVDGLAVKAIKADFVGKYGDRRQEIVFIGGGEKRMNQEAIEAEFDKCLLTDEEMKDYDEAMQIPYEDDKYERLQELFEDGFEEWGFPGEEEEDEEEGHSHGHTHNHKH